MTGLGGLDKGPRRAGGYALFALAFSLTATGCSLVADFGGLDPVEGDPETTDGGGGDGGEGSRDAGGGSDGGIGDGGGDAGLDGGGDAGLDGGGDAGSDGGGSDGGTDGGDAGDAGCDDAVSCCVSGEEANEARCSDEVDNDCNGDVDCNDLKCAEATACCTPEISPTSEASLAVRSKNGVDDDCNGEIDAVIFKDDFSFPQRGGAAGPDAVALIIERNPLASSVQCRVFRDGTSPGAWGTCGLEETPAGLVYRPHSGAASVDDGAYRAEVRWVFEGDFFTKYSELGSYPYYLHNSLRGVERCDGPGSKWALADDTDLIKFAHELLDPSAYGGSTESVFRPGTDTFLGNPFVVVTYEEPLSTSFSSYTLPSSGTSSYGMLSLRRWFRLSGDRRWLIVSRRYVSRRSGRCVVGSFEKHRYLDNFHESQARTRYQCDALVIHRTGAGVCINLTDTGEPTLGHKFRGDPNVVPRALMNGWPTEVNPVMGRQFARERPGTSGHYENFSDKCYSEGGDCPSGDKLFLPDVERFNWPPP